MNRKHAVAGALAFGLCAILPVTANLIAQTSAPVPSAPVPVCECGQHPPGPAPDRIAVPYAGTPDDLRPYAKFTQPYDVNYIHPNIYSGAARDIPVPANLDEVRIGFIGPIEKQADQVFGLRMLHGAQLAVEEANALGGYGGKPFRVMLHDDYNNWQRGAEYGSDRPSGSAIWGAAANEAVKMIYDEQDWAIFGSISSETTHILLRVALRAEIPIINSASTDPTIPETYIPWYFTDLQDDRVQSYTLARRIFTELGLKRVALLRVNNRYGRFGVIKFRDAARRLGHPVVIEQKFLPGETDFRDQLRVIRDSRADGVVLWADEPDAAQILRQMHEMGMKQRVFGSYRTLGDALLIQAGAAAEGFEAVYPYDPSRNDPLWVEFNRRFEARFHEKPEAFAALAYDAMNILLQSICRAGLNRARIQDALDQVYNYHGVTGPMVFDPNNKNVRSMYLGTVHNGKITYRAAGMDRTSLQPLRSSAQTGGSEPSRLQPYAHVGEDGISYLGPHMADIPHGQAIVVLFGPNANKVAETPEVLAALSIATPGWRLLPVASDQNWGTASTELVHALLDEHAFAIIALDRNSSHLAEQLALKTFVPVLALANDTALTSTNVPWIFRIQTDSGPAKAIRILEDAARIGGENPEQLRAVLASGTALDGTRFLPTGEPAR